MASSPRDLDYESDEARIGQSEPHARPLELLCTHAELPEPHDLSNEQLPHEQLCDEQLPNGHLCDEQLPDGHLRDQHVPSQQLPNQQFSDQQSPHQQPPSQQSPNGELPDARPLPEHSLSPSESTTATFIPPSITHHKPTLLSGTSYTHFSPTPPDLLPTTTTTTSPTPCVLGIDEAGRGPVLGPMVYSLFYLPLPLEKPLLSTTHSFMDSKTLTPTTRSHLMRTLCTPSSDLHASCGWAVRVMSARDISAGMLRAGGSYNLNAQAMDATIGLIRETFERGVDVREVFVDTIGSPAVYQRMLERVFPATRITVSKKADALFPCVSAASVCAKVTRDAALEVCYEAYAGKEEGAAQGDWGSGYPSDARCTTWLRKNMDPLFGWGSECRFSWGTVKDMLETKNAPVKVDWPEGGDEDEDAMKVTSFFGAASASVGNGHELANWFGQPVTEGSM
ncbi:MAG: hypothetical protein M1828_003592 [Chrysothrix sp. TS-e1954]|nr:MAG: hypothetical protein M1828_003592 [Chrysothrix sp. TS-e1954]